MAFLRQEYWRGLLFPTPGHLPDPGIKPTSPGGFFIPAELKRKPKNIGLGSLSLLQQIFLAQGLNQSHPALQVDSLPIELLGKPLNDSMLLLSHFSCVPLCATP